MAHKIIQGDPVTQRDMEKFIQDHKMRFYEPEKNKIRLNEHLTTAEKDKKLCMLFYREQQLKSKNRDWSLFTDTDKTPYWVKLNDN